MPHSGVHASASSSGVHASASSSDDCIDVIVINDDDESSGVQETSARGVDESSGVDDELDCDDSLNDEKVKSMASCITLEALHVVQWHGVGDYRSSIVLHYCLD